MRSQFKAWSQGWDISKFALRGVLQVLWDRFDGLVSNLTHRRKEELSFDVTFNSVFLTNSSCFSEFFKKTADFKGINHINHDESYTKLKPIFLTLGTNFIWKDSIHGVHDTRS